jgi:hypothetical protein
MTDAPDFTALARDAAVWGMSLVMMGRYLEVPETGGMPYNQFLMNTEVATPKSAAVGPNIDTLNGRAWLDLSAEPQVIGVPDTADRYYSIQLQDMYMNTFDYIGRRTTGTQAGFFVVTPPGYAGALPAGLTEIKAPTSKITLFVRTMVHGPGDLFAVQAINGAFTLGSLSAFPDNLGKAIVRPGAIDAFQPQSRRTSKGLPHKDLISAGAGYFEELDRLARAFPPLPWDAPNLARFAPIGIGGPAPFKRDPARDAELAAALEAGLDGLVQTLQTEQQNGWFRRRNVLGVNRDLVERAANNLYGPNTQVAEESAFFNKRHNPDDSLLSGAHRYRLRFAAGQTPPVDAFWSLTLYDLNYVLFDNPLNRYGVLDRTQGLKYSPDGALEIQIQADEPAEGPSNWLPSPREVFQLVLRTYQPRQAILDMSWRPPPLEIVG